MILYEMYKNDIFEKWYLFNVVRHTQVQSNAWSRNSVDEGFQPSGEIAEASGMLSLAVSWMP